MTDLDSPPLRRTTETIETTMEMARELLTSCEAVLTIMVALLHPTSDLNLTTRHLEEVPLQTTTATRC